MSATQSTPRNIREVMRDEMVMRTKIVAILNDGAMTIPSVAEALGSPTTEVVYWMMAMRRYGLIEEVGRPDEDGFFLYELKTEES